jgi:hypothetical protein
MTMPLALFDLSMRAAPETNAITAQHLNRNDSPRNDTLFSPRFRKSQWTRVMGGMVGVV